MISFVDIDMGEIPHLSLKAHCNSCAHPSISDALELDFGEPSRAENFLKLSRAGTL